MIRRPVHAVVVAFGSADDLRTCLRTLDRRFEVTVIDNSSSSSVEAVAMDCDVEYVDSGRNRGFAAGVNVALGQILTGTPCDVLLLNPDAAVTPTAVLALQAHLNRHAQTGAVAPRVSTIRQGERV